MISRRWLRPDVSLGARAAGMMTLREDAWRKALRGYTTIAEVLDKTVGVEGCAVPA